jgi:hypothetical protein
MADSLHAGWYTRHGVDLWGGSPLYENLKVFMVMNTTRSTSRRQGSLSSMRGLKEAGAQTCETTARNSIQVLSSWES